MIHEKMKLLGKILKQKVKENGTVELRQTYLALATDTLSSHAFESSLDLLKDDRKAKEWKKTIKAIAILTPLIKQFTWIIPLALRIPLRLLRLAVPDLARIVALRQVSSSPEF